MLLGLKKHDNAIGYLKKQTNRRRLYGETLDLSIGISYNLRLE